jgi:uncharacterized protein
VVAPAHQLTLWSRLGNFRKSDIDRLLGTDRRLFRYCAHADSLVLTEDFPLFHSVMSRYPESLSSSWGSWRAEARSWIPKHRALRRRVLKELEAGPLAPRGFTDHLPTRRAEGEWGSASDVTSMLFHLWMSGEVMMVGREGSQNLWGLSRTFLPDWVERGDLTAEEMERRAAERAIRALGFASRREIGFYFVRGMYQDLKGALADLERESIIRRLEITGSPSRDPLYIHRDDVPLLDAMGSSAWRPRLSLLSPFDNMICWRPRAQSLFSFDHFLEMYVPAEKRKFGYYVLPILWGDRFVGRIDPRVDRERSRLLINAVHPELELPRNEEIGREIAEKVSQLAEFVGVREVVYSGRVPDEWRSALR